MWIDIVIISLCFITVVGVTYLSVSNKKKGKSSCGCDCANCKGCSRYNQKDQTK